jgi:hypothetical protein
MGVLTTLWRVPPQLLEKLRSDPELLERLCLEEKDIDGVTPPSVGVDKAWQDIIDILGLTGRRAARDALDVDIPEIEDSDLAVGFYSADEVRAAAVILSELDVDAIRETALTDENLSTFDGQPIGYLIGYILAHLGTVIDFWQEAAAAGEGILSETS